MKLTDFEGSWAISRRIEDRKMNRVGTLIGSALFAPDGVGLHFAEQGTLAFPGQPALEAKQTYLWRAHGQGIAVLFADGRPFHRIDCDSPRASHWCDPDQYDVNYDFNSWPDWESTWRVNGPRKDYTMITRFTPEQL